MYGFVRSDSSLQFRAHYTLRRVQGTVESSQLLPWIDDLNHRTRGNTGRGAADCLLTVGLKWEVVLEGRSTEI